MTAAQAIIRQARRRLAAGAALTWGGRGAALGALGGIALVVAERRAGLGPGLGLGLAPHAALPIAGLLLGAILGALRGLRADRADVAVHLDRALRLKDRLGTAEAILAGRVGDDPLAQMVLHDADRAVAGIDVRPVIPVRLTRAWAAAVPLAAAWALCLAFLPASASRGEATGRRDETLAVAETARQILDDVDEAVAPLEDSPLDDEIRHELDTLDRLAEQLASPGTDKDVAEARDQSAAKLDSIAERLAAESQRNLDEFDQTARRFSQIAPPAEAAETSAPPSELEQFSEALRDGSLDEAADAFDRLMEAQKDLPPDERRDLAGDLRELAQQLEQPGAPDEALEQQRQEIQKAIDELEQTEQTEQTEQPEQTRQLDQERERLQTEQARREAAEERARRSAEALKRAADEIEKQDKPQADGEQRKSLPESFSPDQQPRPEDQPGDTPPSMSEMLREVDKLRREGLEQRDTAEKLREAARQLADTLTPEQKEALRKQWSGLPQEQKEEIMQQLQDMGSPQDSEDDDRAPSPAPGGNTQGEDLEPRPGAPLPPDAQRFTGFDDIDLRKGAEGDTNIAEWLSNEPVTDPAAVERRSGAMRRAAAAAERAVERSAVPSRYHKLIQRYFGKLPDPAAAPKTPPAPAPAPVSERP